MSVFKGDRIKIELYGESHGERIGVILENLPKIKIDEAALAAFMARRQGGQGYGTTNRREADLPEFIDGVRDGFAEGRVEAVLYNHNKKSSDYDELYGKPRPSHADYASYLCDGTLDFSGGGRFSARLTAPLCVAGYLAKEHLNKQGVFAYAYLSSVGKVRGRSYKEGVSEEELKKLSGFPSLTKQKSMQKEIERARRRGDSVGCTVECVVCGVGGGVGNDYFEGLESKIASLLYAIPAVKAVEFGFGFDLSRGRGSRMNDPLCFRNGKITLKTNKAGGLNGGITNGLPITLRVGLRPTPSITTEQQTVDLVTGENVKIKIKGRHDACLGIRALPIVESALYLALLDEGEYYGN